MKVSEKNQAHLARLVRAFEEDHFHVSEENVVEFEGKIGIMAKHQEVCNIVTEEPKKVYYVEGNHYQMGYLLGLLAERDVNRMCTEFIKNIIPAFFYGDELGKNFHKKNIVIKDLITKILFEFSQALEPDIPEEYKQELHGVLAGCQAANPETEVTWDALWVLNVGVDCLLAHIYTGKFFRERGIRSSSLRIPFMCSGFSIFGEAAKDGKHYFGRDFVFPTAGVFQDTACLIIYNPDESNSLVSQTAPGMIGSIAAMNKHGVAIGVNMLPAPLCNPERPGFNSLLLARYVLQYANSAEEVVEVMQKVPRGVSWLYLVSDGTNDTACIIEAGCTFDGKPFPYFDHIPKRYRKYLPDQQFIEEQQKKYHHSGPENGLMVRWHDYVYPTEYITQYNESLWKFYNSIPEKLKRVFKHLLLEILKPSLFGDFYRTVKYSYESEGELGYINHYKEKNCPGTYYFAPQRENYDNVILCTNHSITPEMRLPAMNDWISLLVQSNINSESNINDLQWRYDELNQQIMNAVKEGVDRIEAKGLLEFLSPYRKFPDYYNPKGKEIDKVAIKGSLSLFELKEKTVESHYGYYGDQWVTISLMNYVSELKASDVESTA